MVDLLLIESGNGGDLVLTKTDLATVNGIENMLYIAMFGGDDEWPGNDIFFSDDPDSRIVSQTEKVLMNVALTSDGRIKIQDAVKADLDFLYRVIPGVDITVTVVFPDNDQVKININLSGKDYSYLWHPDSKFLEYKL